MSPQYEQSTCDAPTLSYDAEWLAVMRKTHHLLSTSRGNVSVPSTVQPATPTVIMYYVNLMSCENDCHIVEFRSRCIDVLNSSILIIFCYD